MDAEINGTLLLAGTCPTRPLLNNEVLIPSTISEGFRTDIQSVHFDCRALPYIFYVLQVEGMNCLVSELADVSAQERAMLDECEALLASTAALQVEEYSLRTHLIQMKHTLKNGQQPMIGNRSTYMTAQMLS
ncbi:hypothetical protein CsSME_00008209 [Camellia sinensis var. sinensis]